MTTLAQNSIRWNQHQTNLQAMFSHQLNQGRFCDVLLAGDDGQTLRAHRNVLCANSEYFDRCLKNINVNTDTLIIVKDCQQDDIRLIIEFMYNGIVNVDVAKMASFYDVAKRLEVKGLVDALNSHMDVSTESLQLTDSMRTRSTTVMNNNISPSNEFGSERAPLESTNHGMPIQKWDAHLGQILSSQQNLFTVLTDIQRTIDSLKQSSTMAPAINAHALKPSNTSALPQQRHKLNVIRTVEELDVLEENLKDDAYWSEVFNGMKSVCGENSGSPGLNCSYLLVDNFFSRDFMNQCSWGGGSRTPDTKKIAFKTYERTIRMFFDLVHLADPHFTEEQTYNFFQGILKNSKKRCLCNPKRRSAMKRRPGGISYHSTSMPTTENNCGLVIGDTSYSADEVSGDNTNQGRYLDDTQEDQEDDEDMFEVRHSFKEERTDEEHVDNTFAGPSWRNQGL